MDKIIIKGARENNLQNVDLEIPKNSLVVMTGVSGSGKTGSSTPVIISPHWAYNVTLSLNLRDTP